MLEGDLGKKNNYNKKQRPTYLVIRFILDVPIATKPECAVGKVKGYSSPPLHNDGHSASTGLGSLGDLVEAGKPEASILLLHQP